MPVMLRYHLLIAVIIPAALAGNNSTIVVPPKASNHGDPNLLCLPAAWTDIVVFLLGNYVAHAATIKTLPGESPIGVMIAAVAALLFPMAGAVRGLDAIMSFAILGANDLEKAARAQALCMVKKTEGSSRPTGTFLTTAFRGVSELLDLMVRSFRTLTRTHGVRGQSNKYNNIALFSTKVHGRFHIPERFRENYALVPVSWYAKFQHEETVNQSPRKNSLNWVASQFKEPRKSTTTLSCNYNLVKVLIALGQVVYATATLYRTRGNQIARYGYSAFGLTVAPYALMSIVNLIGNIMCPEYPAMYLVWSKDMGALINEMKSEEQEGKEKDGVVTSQSLFDGVVGSLDEDHTAGDINSFTTHFVSMPAIILVVISALPIAVVGALLSFHKGSSTLSQRVWTMTWLAFGIYMTSACIINMFLESRDPYLNRGNSVRRGLALLLIFSILSIPAIGGFITVGKMLREYGVCVRIT